jgi:stage IV sporulation protein FB
MHGWTLVRILGIDIRVHPTFFILVALVGLGWFGPPASGFVWLVLVFSCVVAHELAHSVVARGRGMPVKDIVLLPIGGASEIEHLTDRPRDELVVAAVGPISSLALGGTLLVVSWGLYGSFAPPSLVTGSLVGRLAWTNVMLGTFNMLPALPMDGGRVYRASVALRRGAEVATHRAARLSRWLAGGLAVVGFVMAPWLLIIAAFVWTTGRAEEAAMMLHLRLAGLRARDAMVPVEDPRATGATIVVTEDEPLEQAVGEIVAARGRAAAVVDDDDEVIGVLVLDQVADLLRGT